MRHNPEENIFHYFHCNVTKHISHPIIVTIMHPDILTFFLFVIYFILCNYSHYFSTVIKIIP